LHGQSGRDRKDSTIIKAAIMEEKNKLKLELPTAL
jgi:hypothetical protein